MVTSVSRSGPDDETPEGTGTGVSADRGASVAPETTDAAASPARPVKAKPAAKPRSSPARSSSARTKASTTSKPAGAKSGAKTSTAKSTSTKTTAAKADDASGADAAPKPARKPAARRSNTTAAKAPAPVEAGPADSDATEAASAASGDAGTSAAAPASAAAKTTAARKPAARKPAARKPSSRSTAAPAEVEPEAVDASPEEPTEAAASKRSAASRSASSSAAAKRTAAAKNVRTPSVSLAQAKERAADARKKAVARQRVAAAMTTDTTEAERPPRRSDDSVAPAKADPAPVAEEAPVVEAPAEVVVVEEPEDGRSVAEESPAEEAVAAEPVAEEPATAEPVVEEPAAEPVEAPSEVDDDARAVGDERGVAVIPVGSSKPAPRKKRTLRVARPAPEAASRVLAIDGLVKRYGDTTAVDAISLEVRAGSFYGIVGPNGAGKTTTLSMVTGLLRPDAGTVHINDIDVWKDPRAAKRATGVLPDRLRLFDRLTGSELLYYSGSLRGLDHATVLDRSADLATAFGLEDALDRLVADYSAGMTKKIALACAMIHSPRLLVLDEPFESVDPVSAANLTDILERYVAGGGTVLLSSHSMDLIERVCDSAAIIVGGRVLASGPLDEVRQGQTLEDRFVELAGGRKAAEGLEWLHSFSD